MRIFITGASGFVGAALIRLAVSQGADVLALLTPGKPPERLHDLKGQYSALEARLHETERLRDALRDFRPDACVHLAWYAEPGKYLYAAENVPMLQQSLNLIEVLTSVGCRQNVFVGTCAEYDTDVGFLREDGPTRPTTIYAASKLALYTVGQHMAASAQVNLAWARLFYLYGPYEDPRRLIPAVIAALRRGEDFPATAGEQVRDYLHLADVASALWTLASQPLNGIYNIASGVPVTIRALMEQIGDLLDGRHHLKFGALPYRAWEPMFICGSAAKLRGVGWTPQYTLRAGLEAAIRWWDDWEPR